MMTVACDNAEEIMEILMQDANTHQLINYQINDVLVRVKKFNAYKEYSKLETNEFKVNFKFFSLKNFIHSVASLFETQAQAKGLNYIVTIAENAPQ